MRRLMKRKRWRWRWEEEIFVMVCEFEGWGLRTFSLLMAEREDEDAVPFVGEKQLNVSPTVAARDSDRDLDDRDR
jgi:hypothetical protein